MTAGALELPRNPTRFLSATQVWPVQRMAEKCSPLMDGILSEAESSSGQSAAEDLLVKEGRAAASLKKRLRDLLNEEGSSSDEELVMRKGRGQERETTRAQRRKIRRLETRVDALERKNSRLEDLLVNKLAALISRLSQRGERDPLGNETSGRPAACNCRCACHPETSADKATTSTEPNGNATPALPEVDEQEPHTSAAPAPPRVDKQDLNGNTAPDLPEVDGQIKMRTIIVCGYVCCRSNDGRNRLEWYSLVRRGLALGRRQKAMKFSSSC
ncbi:uncharacterized protein LOC144107801 isoform X5 [Amblyomma americanum]